MNLMSFVEFFDRPVSLRLTYAMLHFIWQGTIFSSVLFVFNALLRSQSPRLRYAVALVALLLMVACLPANYVWFRPALNPSDYVRRDSPALQTDEIIVVAEPASALTANNAMEVIVSSSRSSLIEKWAPLAVVAYTAGVLLMTLRLVCSTVGVLRMRAFSIGVTDSRLVASLGKLTTDVGLRIKPALAICEKLAVPVVVGIVKPVVLLPPFVATGMTANELEAILLHELAHIRRNDLLINTLQRVAESFLFFHPGVWYVSRCITRERENCCDDVAVSMCSRQDYASSLIRLAESCTGKRHEMAPVAALAATGASPSQLKRRVMRILGEATPFKLDIPGFCFQLAFIVAISIAAFNVHAQVEQSDAGAGEQAHNTLAEVESNDEESTFQDDTSFVGPVQMETLGEVLLIRGARRDLDRIQGIIADLVERTRGGPASIETTGSPIQIETNDSGQLILTGESEQAVKALEELLRGSEIGSSGAAEPEETGQREHKVRLLRLTKETKPGIVQVALDAFLEGKGIDQKDVSYDVRFGEDKAELSLSCRDEHYEQISKFLTKRGWITDGESNGTGYSLFYLKYFPAERMKSVLREVFLDADVTIIADNRLNRVFVTAPSKLLPQIAEIIKDIDTERKDRLPKRMQTPDSKAQIDALPQLRFTFRHVPWSGVLQWIATHTQTSLNLDHTPRGTFSFEDSSRTYSPAEAFDVINEALYLKGYGLLRRNKRMYIVDFEDKTSVKSAHDLLSETPQADLDERGEFELTKCRFEVSSKDMSRIHADIEPLLGTRGSMVVIPVAKQFVIVDIGRNLRLIRSVIRDRATVER